jgi:hypothetical protein
VKARGVGETIVKVGGWGASVVTSSGRGWVSRVRSAGMMFRFKSEDKTKRMWFGRSRIEGCKVGGERTNGRSLEWREEEG